MSYGVSGIALIVLALALLLGEASGHLPSGSALDLLAFAIALAGVGLVAVLHARVAPLAREVARASERLELLVRHLPAGIAVVARGTGAVLHTNLQAEQWLPLLGAGPDEAVSELGGHALETLLDRGPSHPVEIVVEEPTRRLFAVSAASLRGESEATEQVVLMIREATQERHDEHRMRQQERLIVLGELAGGIAHDFNNLVGVILNYAAFVEERVPADDTEMREDVAAIIAAGERAAALTEQLLAFGRRQVVTPGVISLSEVVRDMHDILRRALSERHTLRLELDDDLWHVFADRTRLEQVLLNLVVNARDAMADAGVVTVRTRNLPPEGDDAEARPDARRVMLEVQDTGTGMSEEVRLRIFEPFFTTKQLGRGTGLGMATVYGIVRQADGQIEVHSKLGEGTRFELVLPATDAVQRDTLRQTATKRRRTGGETILVVEDEEKVRQAAARILRSAGHRVLQAPHPAAALEVARDHNGPIALLLTDVIMPEMSGPELAARLRKERPETPVLFMSGYPADYLSAQVEGSGRAPLVSKPFTADRLLREVEQALGTEAADLLNGPPPPA